MNFYLIKILSIFLLVITSACSKIKDKKEEDKAVAPVNLIQGLWKGYYRSKDQQGNLTQPLEVSWEFSKDGRFKVSVPSSTNASAVGTYKEFQNTSIYLTVEESNISFFGVKGTILQMNYQRVGSTLSLIQGDHRYELFYGKDQNQTSPQNQEENHPTEEHLINGAWGCGDDKSNHWQLQFSKEDFKGTISNPSTSVVLNISGKIVYEVKERLKVKVLVSVNSINPPAGISPFQLRLNQETEFVYPPTQRVVPKTMSGSFLSDANSRIRCER